MPHYPAALVKTHIENWFKKAPTKNHRARRAWVKLKGYALVVAASDYGLRPRSSEAEKDKALAYVWEDFTIAMRGYGDNAVTGFLLQILSSLTPAGCKSLGEALATAVKAADDKASLDGVVRRYEQVYIDAPVIYDAQAFRMPYAVPIAGAPIADWVRDHEDDDVAEVILEELRARHAAAEQGAAVRVPRKAPKMAERGHLRLVHDSASNA